MSEYPGTILFVTHDRFLVQKLASHLIYIEDGKSYIFDRLSAFEKWLAKPAEATAGRTAADASRSKNSAAMSKNKRDRLRKEAADLEAQIAAVEGELKTLEQSFQSPDSTVNWETIHRRYDELKGSLDGLYAELSRRWEALD